MSISDHRKVREQPPRTPPPATATTTDAQLAQLEAWARFEAADGFLIFHFTDSASIQLHCGRRITIPEAGFPEEVNTGWVGEFVATMVSDACPLILDHQSHVVVVAQTWPAVVAALYEAVRLGSTHVCHGQDPEVRPPNFEEIVAKMRELYGPDITVVDGRDEVRKDYPH
jgi:hypothetical protein